MSSMSEIIFRLVCCGPRDNLSRARYP